MVTFISLPRFLVIFQLDGLSLLQQKSIYWIEENFSELATAYKQ